MASGTDSDSTQRASDEGEEEDDSCDLSDVGAAATCVKFQTVQQQSYQVAEGGENIHRRNTPSFQLWDGLERFQLEVLERTIFPNYSRAGMAGLRDWLNRFYIRVSCRTNNLYQHQGNIHWKSHVTVLCAVATEVILQQNFIQVQQQFGDVTVQGTRNLTIGGTQNIGKSGFGQNENEKALNKKMKILNDTAKRIKSWTKGMVRTSSLEKVMERLNRNMNWITIVGSPGEGKTTVAYMALKELQRTRQVFQVCSPKEFTEVTSTCSQPVILLDDVFGKLEFDQAKWSLWKPVLHQVLDETEHRSHEQSEIVLEGNGVTVLLVGRDYVLKSASCDMGRLADYFTQDEYVVNMSHNLDRTTQEKQAIWKSISDSSGIELDQNTVDQICRNTCPHGFPHVCRLFATLYKRDTKITAEGFFNAPMEFLNQTVQIFMKSKVKLSLFKDMIKRDGRVSIRELENMDSGSEAVDTANDLVGTYLRKEDSYFIFDHPSIYDIVALNLCVRFPLFVVENCNLSFIHERLRFIPVGHTNHNTLCSESSLAAYIPRTYFKDLAKRFAVEISNRHLLHVVSHKAFTDEMFTKEVMTQITVPLTELMRFTDSNSGEHFLSLIASSKSPQLLKYIDSHTDIQLTQSDINTALYGVCKYAASDVMTYLMEAYKTLDINQSYGDMKKTTLMIAAETRDSQLVDQIMSLYPNLDACDAFHNKTVLHYLCENGLVAAAEQVIVRTTGRLLAAKDWWGWSPLRYAVRGNKVDVVRLLLDKGAIVEDEVIALACKKGTLDIVKLLLGRGATVNMTFGGGAPLDSACLGGHMKIISFLLAKDASVNTPGLFGRYPLHVACLSRQSRVVRCLLEHGADVRKVDRRGNTPLHVASDVGSKSCVDALLEAGADVNVQNGFRNTPLCLAKRSGFKECVDVLLKAGADVSKVNEDEQVCARDLGPIL